MKTASWEAAMTNDLKIIVEEHADGFVACPAALRGVIAGHNRKKKGTVLSTKSSVTLRCASMTAANDLSLIWL